MNKQITKEDILLSNLSDGYKSLLLNQIGLSNSEIAIALGKDEKTVENTFEGISEERMKKANEWLNENGYVIDNKIKEMEQETTPTPTPTPTPAPETKAVSAPSDSVQKILNLDCKKQLKTYLLSRLGLDKKEIATLQNTNTSRVRQDIAKIESDPSRIREAEEALKSSK